MEAGELRALVDSVTLMQSPTFARSTSGEEGCATLRTAARSLLSA